MENYSLLIVDDNEQVLRSLSRLLRKEAFTCYLASDVAQAFSLIRERDIHVVLSDIKMPGTDGLKFLKRIAGDYPDMIRLAISGDSEIQTVIKAVNDGNVLRYIAKPWEDLELVNTLRQAFELYRLREDKKELIRQLKESNTSLEKKVEERTRALFEAQNAAEIGKHTSQIVHNLNNPLNAISGSVQMICLLLDQDPPDLEGIRKFVEYAVSGSEEMAQIIASILFHVRDYKDQNAEILDLNDLIKSVLKLYEIDEFYRHQVRKITDLDPSLPGIRGSRIQLKQVVDNLVKNAIQAMEETREKTLTVTTGVKGETIVLEIGDTGCGIPEDQLDRIFLPDFTTKPIGKGTGLGLASVKAMVQGYYGTIRVSSQLGRGTVFTVELPCVR